MEDRFLAETLLFDTQKFIKNRTFLFEASYSYQWCHWDWMTSLNWCSHFAATVDARHKRVKLVQPFSLPLVTFKPAQEIMALLVLRKLILQTRMRSHPVGLDVWCLVGPFVYFHISCVRTAKALATLRECAVISTIISWTGSFGVFGSQKNNVWFYSYWQDLVPLWLLKTLKVLLLLSG